MKDYTIWLNGGNSIGGTAKEADLIELKEYFKKVKQGETHSGYEFKDTEGIVCVSLSDIQAIAITKCTENKDIGFSPYKFTGDKEICLAPQMDVNKCMEKLTNKLVDGLNSIKR